MWVYDANQNEVRRAEPGERGHSFAEAKRRGIQIITAEIQRQATYLNWLNDQKQPREEK